jgi:creatinine amidohydrolase/Fe(II)-dependent formamide hydrolase-like protein
MTGETVYRPLRGNDVEARIKMDCRSALTLATSMADLSRELDLPTLTGTFVEQAKAISTFMSAGKVTIEHPAAAMGQSLINNFDRALIRSAEIQGVPTTPETRREQIQEALGGYDPAKLTTERGQRELSANVDQPYVRRAVVSCLP